ncbi:MAG: glycosyltransferase [Ilumatobacteraceae bacterium]
MNGVQLRPVPKVSGRLRRVTLGSVRMFRAVMRTKADVYHFHDPELLPLGLALKLARRTVVYDSHEWVSADVGSKPYLHPAVARSLAVVVGGFERLVARTIDRVVAATPTIARQFRPETTVVVHNYPELDELGRPNDDAPLTARPLHACYAGIITKGRCCDELVEAVSLVVTRHPEFRLVMAGELYDIDDPSDAPGIDYRGLVPRSEVAAILADARFGVVLVRALPNYVDSLPTKFFEYAMAGLPIVVSRTTKYVAEIAETFQCGLVVDEEDPEAIAEAINWLIEHPQEAEEMGRRGLEATRTRFNWGQQSEILRAMYAELAPLPTTA